MLASVPPLTSAFAFSPAWPIFTMSSSSFSPTWASGKTSFRLLPMDSASLSFWIWASRAATNLVWWGASLPSLRCRFLRSASSSSGLRLFSRRRRVWPTGAVVARACSSQPFGSHCSQAGIGTYLQPHQSAGSRFVNKTLELIDEAIAFSLDRHVIGMY